MTDKTALRQLIEAVEAGTATILQFLTWRPGLAGTRKESQTMVRAYGGSLDAAKALHEALLPGWDYIVSRANGGLTTHVQLEQEITFNDCPARAWLIAILKAYEAQQ